jgi:hypothetical protein
VFCYQICLLSNVFLQRSAAINKLAIAFIAFESDKFLIKRRSGGEAFLCKALADLWWGIGVAV